MRLAEKVHLPPSGIRAGLINFGHQSLTAHLILHLSPVFLQTPGVIGIIHRLGLRNVFPASRPVLLHLREHSFHQFAVSGQCFKALVQL